MKRDEDTRPLTSRAEGGRVTPTTTGSGPTHSTTPRVTRIRRVYEPDPERCATALLRLLEGRQDDDAAA